MNYINYKQQPAKRSVQIATWKRVLVLFLSLSLTAAVVIFAYGETGQSGDYEFYGPLNDGMINEEEPYHWNYEYESSYALEDYSGYYGYVESDYINYAPQYMYDSDSDISEDMDIFPLYPNFDHDYDIEFFVEIGLLEFVENGVILHDYSELEYFNTPEAGGGYIGIQPLGDVTLTGAAATWTALQNAINAPAVPTTTAPASYHPTPYVITLNVAQILIPPDPYTRILVGNGRNIQLVSGPNAAANENGNVRLVKTGAAAEDAGRHFVVHSRARLELNGITLTRSDAMVNGICAINGYPYNGGGIMVRERSHLHITGGSIIENVRKNRNAILPWFSPAAIHANDSYVFLYSGVIRNNISQDDSGGVGLRHGSIGRMYDGFTITGNRSLTNLGGGVSVASFETRNRPVYTDSFGPHGPRPLELRDAEFHMYGGTITHNSAYLDGGGIRVGIEALFVMHDGLIAYNYSHRRGGGVEIVEDSTFRWYGGTIRNNGRNPAGQITTLAGGGLSVVGGSILEVPASSSDYRRILNNASIEAGGGLYMSTAGAGWHLRGVTASRISRASTLIIPSNVPFIVENNHTNGNGGGIYLLNEAFLNRLNEVINFGANVTMNSGRIANNTAHGSGGGMSVSGTNSIANLTAGVVRGNTALNGGGASVIDLAVFTLSGSAQIYNNLATTTPTNLEANGGGVFASTGSTFNLEAPNAIHNNIARANGPGARANGGGFVVHGNTLVMYPGTSFTNNRVEALNGATVNGAGLAVLSGTFTLYAGRTISGNTAHATGTNSEALGGGVLLGGGTFIAASGSNITNNNAVAENGATARGGAISVNGSAPLSPHIIQAGAVVTGNTATATADDGVSTLAQGGGVIVSAGTLTINDGANVTNNTATSEGNMSMAQGGGFAAIGGLLNLNIDVEDNFVTATSGGTVQGGGAFVGGGQITIIGKNITHNTAVTDGGNIYGVGLAMSGGIFAMSDDTEITNNLSTIIGGINVFGGGVAMLLGPDGITGGTLNMSGGEIHNNSATQGGGVWMIGGTMNLSGGSIHNNDAVYYGGGILLTGAIGAGAGSATLNMTGGTIGNTGGLTVYELGNSATRGGGVHISRGAQFNMNPGPGNTYGTIVGNTATAAPVQVNINGIPKDLNAGGGVHMVGATTVFTLNAGLITANFGHAGGGVGIASGTFNMHGGTISENRAVTGGGVRVFKEGDYDAVFNMHGGTISHNTLRNRTPNPPFISGGGGVNIDYGVANIHGGVLEHNRGLYGGAIHVRNLGSILNIHGGRIRNNIGTQEGGAVRVVRGGYMTMRGGYIYRNESLTYGGGVGVVSVSAGTNNGVPSEFRMYGGTIGGAAPAGLPAGAPNPNANTTTYSGGGVAIVGGASFVMNEGGTPGNLTRGTIIGNLAAGSVNTRGGGGVFLSDTNSTFVMNTGTITQNRAAGPLSDDGGGGVLVRNNAQFTMNNGHIHENTAAHGGGVRVTTLNNVPAWTDTSFVMNGGIIENNIVVGPGMPGDMGVGGGVHLTRATFTMFDGIIRYNQNTINGGGVRLYGGGILDTTFIMHGGRIYGNEATNLGGGIALTNTQTYFRMHGGTIGGERPAALPASAPNPYANTAAYGGGVHVLNNARFYIIDYTPAIGPVVPSTGIIIGNNATTNGGGIWVAANSTVTATSATITHNTTDGMGGGIFTARYEYACPITRYPGAAGVLPANVAYSNLTLTGVVFNHNQSNRRHVPPRNAWDVIAAAAFTQTSFPASPPPIHNHPLNNCDINFFNSGIDFDFHKTDDRIFNQALWDWGNPGWVNSILLSGAHFSLYRYVGAGTPTTQASVANLYPAGNWVHVDNAISTGLIGTPISFQLFYGVYHQLVEHVAPTGFQAPFGQWQVRYGASGINITIVGTAPTIHYIPCDCNSNNCEGGSRFVGNMRQFELPLAGGTGSSPFIMAGSVVLGVAFVAAGIIVINKAKVKKAAF